MRTMIPAILTCMLCLLVSACGPALHNPAGAMPPSTTVGIDTREIEILLREHNRVRADVGVGPLSWSADLGRFAQDWADHLATTQCDLKHRPGSGKWQQRHGENLFMGTAGAYGVRDAVLAWEAEKKDYRYGDFTGTSPRPIGHYTQVIWNNSKHVGCGKALCKDLVIIACNYDPPGNFIGERPY